MTFTYTYRSSDGERHTAEIEAESRDAAFGRLRTEYGIKPIKVTVAGRDGQGPGHPRHPGDQGAKARSNLLGVLGVLGVLAILVALAVLALTGRWRAIAGARDARPYQVMTPQGPVTMSMAQPLARQRIPGDRARIEAATALPSGIFKHAAEAWLARYAEPGRAWNASEGDGTEAGRNADKGRTPVAVPSDADFEAALREPIRIASTDYTEWVDMKRIVAGMKREMQTYLAGGGTVEGYLAELAKRQKLEISYRERAEERLKELLAAGARDARPYQAEAYAYWLKANAQLKAMGIWELPLPDALRAYQMGLGLDE